MMRTTVALTFLALALASQEHPIEGVIKLIEELQETAKEEGVTDTGNYEAYAKWCAESKETLNSAIKKEKSEISRLTDKISGLTDEIEVLDNDIVYLGKQIEEQNNAAAKAKAIREKAAKLYKEEKDNLVDTTDAVDDAVKVLKKSQSLLQTSADRKALLRSVRKAAVLTEFKMSDAQHAGVKKFLEMVSSPSFLQRKHEGVPDKAYEDHGGDIIETFEGMSEDFEVETEETVESETRAKNEYNRAKTARDSAIKAAEDAKETKETEVSDKRSKKAQAESDKTAEGKALVTDSTAHDSTTQDCQTTKDQFEERTKTRNDEIEAMEMAKKILSEVTGVRNPDEHEIPKKGSKLLQSGSKTFDYGAGDDSAMSFLQLHGENHRDLERVRTQVSQILLKVSARAHVVHKKALVQLAEDLKLYEGPFDKIIQMVQKMIFHLMAEQKDEDDTKNWCDVETETNTESKDDKTAKLRTFTLKIEEMDSAVKVLTKEINDNNKKVKELNEHIEEETELRKENHDEIMLTIKDAKDAQAALSKAHGILTKFYKDSGMIAKEPWEFLQISAAASAPGDTVTLPDSPSTWDAEYTGVSDPTNGDNAVLKLLEETETKFADMEATAKVQDNTDQKNFDADMQASKIDLAETETDTTMKTERSNTLQEKIEGMTEAKKHMARELSAVEAYLKDLETPCSMGEDSYEDRKQARTDELEALREAQNILTDTQKKIVDKAEARAKNKKETVESGEN